MVLTQASASARSTSYRHRYRRRPRRQWTMRPRPGTNLVREPAECQAITACGAELERYVASNGRNVPINTRRGCMIAAGEWAESSPLRAREDCDDQHHHRRYPAVSGRRWDRRRHRLRCLVAVACQIENRLATAISASGRRGRCGRQEVGNPAVQRCGRPAPPRLRLAHQRACHSSDRGTRAPAQTVRGADGPHLIFQRSGADHLSSRPRLSDHLPP